MGTDKQSIVDEYRQNRRGIVLAMAGVREKVVSRVHTDKKRIALTFDCGYGQSRMHFWQLVGLLIRYRIKSTFFVTGQYCRKHPFRIKLLFRLGMETGNHSDSHPVFTKLSSETCLKELNKCSEEIEKLTGSKPVLFRFPEGEYEPNCLRIVSSAGLIPVQWDVDTHDWRKDLTDNQIFCTLTEQVKPGSIVLCHEAGSYYKGIRRAVRELKNQGYRFVTVSGLLSGKEEA